MKTQNELINCLKDAGMRITPQRIAICKALVESHDHPSASQLYDKLKQEYPSLSLATIYNTLDALVGQGMINILGDAGDGRVHFDAYIGPHINLACLKCHQITDIESDLVPRISVEVSNTSGYEIKGSRVFYYGICPACQQV